jgi:hypothetical protein
MEKKRVYISGAMTGIPDFNRQAFQEAEDYLTSLGYEVINPHKIPLPLDFKGCYLDYIKLDIVELITCDTIFMLKGWETSRGANIEIFIAKSLEFEVIYQ